MAEVGKLVFPDFDVSKSNLIIASNYLANDWTLTTEAEKQSWKVRSWYGVKETDGFFYYQDYFVGTLYSQNSTTNYIESIDLTLDALLGYGTMGYGISTFGTSRGGAIPTRSYEDRAARRWVLTFSVAP